MSEECYNCGKEYSHLGMHWRRGECDYPKVTERQHQIIEGCLMGDGHLDFSNKSPKFHVSNTNRRFLEWLKGELSEHVSRLYLHSTAEEQSDIFQKHDMGEWKCSDVYRLSTRTLPALEEYRHWYPESGVRFPDGHELTELSLKIWYCCDGTLYDGKSIRFGSKNEMEREDMLKGMFSPFNVEPTISSWNLVFSQEETEKLFDIMREPVPGMEEKWP